MSVVNHRLTRPSGVKAVADPKWMNRQQGVVAQFSIRHHHSTYISNHFWFHCELENIFQSFNHRLGHTWMFDISKYISARTQRSVLYGLLFRFSFFIRCVHLRVSIQLGMNRKCARLHVFYVYLFFCRKVFEQWNCESLLSGFHDQWASCWWRRIPAEQICNLYDAFDCGSKYAVGRSKKIKQIENGIFGEIPWD